MKKLIGLAALAAGVAYVVKYKSGQVKAAATKVTGDPRVQSALATASEKAAPLADSARSAVSNVRSGSDDLTPPPVPKEAVEVAEQDPVSAPEFTDTETPESQQPAPKSDPLTDPLGDSPGDTDEPKGPTA